MPGVVTSIIDELYLDRLPGEGRVLELGTGTGHSTALLATVLGEQRVTSVEVDPEVSARAREALETVGLHPTAIAADGLVGYPDGGPYDRVIATFAVRDIPHTWVDQVRPGGTIVATVGVWAYGTGLARLVVDDTATAMGRLVRTSSFMPARAQATRYRDDLFTLAEHADSERGTTLDPDVLGTWMPALLIQLALPHVHLTAVTSDDDARGPVTYLVSENTASFAEIAPTTTGWHVRQGGPVAIWDTVEDTLEAWANAGSPGIESVQVRVDREGSTYWIGDDPALRWVHPA
jgi:protein-L-isoaspartate O-methyltransferase